MRYSVMNLPATYSIHASEAFKDFAVQVDYGYLEQFYSTLADAQQAAREHYAKELANEN